MIDDELVHTIKNIVMQVVLEHRPWAYGHITDYDPNAHAARVIVPSMRDDTGALLHSGWLPMHTALAGAGYGLQVVPLGGSTDQDPTVGEQVLVALNERGSGVASILGMFFTNAQQSPNTALPSGAKVVPGDVILTNTGGAVIYQHATGDIDIMAGEGASASVNVVVTGGGNIALTTPQQVIIDAREVLMVSDLHVSGEIVRGFNGPDQVTLGQHEHAPGGPKPVPGT